MILKQIFLKNYRNFTSDKFGFNPLLTIIIGENAKGKTNLLEAIFLILQGSGFRETREDELIKFGSDSAEIMASFGSNDEQFIFQIVIKKNEKIFLINKAKKRHFQYLKETAELVLFQPEQIEIMTGSPDKRRRYFDSLISSFDLEYKKRLVNYENALRKRNKILEVSRDEIALKEELSFWDTYLTENGGYITQKRQEYVDFLNENRNVDSKEFFLDYLKNEFNQKRLDEKFELERRYRKTVIGPQKDDLQLYQSWDSQKKNLHHFGSRSEQRLGIFWLKFNEIKYIEETLKVKPILLLDDIFSELDMKNKKLIIDLVKKYQTIVTTTEIKLLELANMPKTIIKL